MDEEEIGLRHQLLRECNAMAQFAFASARKLSPELLLSLAMLEEELKGRPGATSLEVIGSVHAQLAEVVAPAMPRGIYLIHSDRSRHGWLSMLGPVPTVRRLMLTSAFFTFVFVLSSLSSRINLASMSLDIYRMHGSVLLTVLIFLMSAAGMGAGFHALFIIQSYVAEGTYDPRYDSSYWISIGLGIISGLLISQLVPIGPEITPELAQAFEEQLRGNTTSTPNGSGLIHPNLISKPVLALLGGFSATMVYNVLQRMVSALEAAMESLFKGKGGESRASRDHMARADVPREVDPVDPSTHVVARLPRGTARAGGGQTDPGGAQPTGEGAHVSPPGRSPET